MSQPPQDIQGRECYPTTELDTTDPSTHHSKKGPSEILMWESMAAFAGLKTDDPSNDRWSISLTLTYTILSLLWGATSRQQGVQLQQVSETDGTFLASLVVFAVAQVVTLTCLLVPEGGGRDDAGSGIISKAFREPLVVAILSHVGLALLMSVQATSDPWLSWPALCLPTMALLASWAVTSVSPKPHTFLATLAVCCGGVFSCLIPSQVFSLSRTSVVSSLVGVSWLLRNMVIKQLVTGHGDSNGRLDIKFRGSLVFGTFSGLSLLLFIAVSLSLPTWLPWVLCSLASCAIGTGLTFITAQLLHSNSLLSLTMIQVWVQMLEAALMSSQPLPEGLLWVMAVALVALGHYTLIKDRADLGDSTAFTPSHTPVGVHEQYTRMEFLLFSCGVLAVFGLVFQPRVSERDMETLSYVGLDKVFRHLLATPENLTAG